MKRGERRRVAGGGGCGGGVASAGARVSAVRAERGEAFAEAHVADTGSATLERVLWTFPYLFFIDVKSHFGVSSLCLPLQKKLFCSCFSLYAACCFFSGFLDLLLKDL